MRRVNENDVVELAKNFISIPSYVDHNNNEVAVMDYLAQFFSSRFPSSNIERQNLQDSQRYNLVVSGANPKLLVLGHVDTVRPKENWKTNPLRPVIKEGKLYGLGAADMKGSLAAFLYALAQNPSATDNLAILLYVDEEYDFLGMKRFLQSSHFEAVKPEMILSLDGNLELSSGCRGLIEISAKVAGRSGHSSNPANGTNAITRTMDIMRVIEKKISQTKNEDLGQSTLNIAYLRGGTVQRQDDSLVWQREGNVIPDFVDLTFEIRTATDELSADQVKDLFHRQAEKHGLTVQEATIRHDLRPWLPSYTSDKVRKLQNAYKRAGVVCKKADRKLSGFIDVQMVVDEINVPAFIIGAGGGNKHGADEYVPVENLLKATELYKEILEEI